MERLTEKDQYSHEYKVQAKNLDSHCVAKDKRGYVTYYGHHIDKLAEYEDLEEQGLLLRLPCKVGDTVYSIANDGKIYSVKATREVKIVNGVLHIICESCKYVDLVSYDDIGKTVFLTQAEAEQKLKEKESE